jgi:hypothetical protein
MDIRDNELQIGFNESSTEVAWNRAKHCKTGHCHFLPIQPDSSFIPSLPYLIHRLLHTSVAVDKEL